MSKTFTFSFSGKNAQLRQKELNDPLTGGKIFNEEYRALERLALISWAMPVGIVVSSILDLVFVIAFQRWLHPWRRILVEKKGQIK